MSSQDEATPAERVVFCTKLKKEAPALDSPPLPGPLGQKIYEQVSKEAWKLWLGRQTTLVNEYRLNMADPKARAYLIRQTEGFFFGEGADMASGYVPLQDGPHQ